MITHLNGKLVEKTPTYLVIECNGIGYFVKISLNSYSQLSDEEHIKIYTQLQVREDAHTLYGFHTTTEREMFNQLISVSGIGANTAILMLSALSPQEIAAGITSGDVALIQSVKGIGAKTAQRVIIDLKDKVAKLSGEGQIILPISNTNENDTLNALISLGFDKNRAEKAVKKVSTDGQSVEEMIKEALKVL